MKDATFCSLVVFLVIVCSFATPAQQTATTPAVPRLVNFAGTLTDAFGKPLTAITGVTFALYKDQRGGAPLWLETQNVMPNAAGAYSVLLGSMKSGGLPVGLFASGEARWLGVQIQGQPEQPRVLMVAVPYALKAADSETVGGLPPSAFALAVPSNVPSAGSNSSGSAHDGSGAILPPVGGGGTTNYVPLWTSSTNLGNSNIYQNSSKFVGIGTTSPASTLDVNGAEYVRGQLFLPASGTATPTQGFNSRVQNFTASSYNSNTHSAENHSLQWVAEPLGNNTPSPSATLHLRFFSTGGALETGYSIGSNGLVTFAKGQTFPGTGTITGVTAGTDLTGGGTSGIVTVNLDTTKVPQLATNNTYTGIQTIIGSNGGGASALVVQGDSGGGVGIDASGELGGVRGNGGSNGVIGTCGHSPICDGVIGYSDCCHAIGVEGDAGYGNGVLGTNSSPDSAAIQATNSDTGSTSPVFSAQGNFGNCLIDTSGNLTCTGTKSAAVPVPGNRKVALYAVEAPENWFEDFGTGRIVDGTGKITIDPRFAQTINSQGGYHVFVTPKGECNGLYVTNESAGGFEVRELGHGHSSVEFDYRIVAHRKGFEKVRMADVTERMKAIKPHVRSASAIALRTEPSGGRFIRPSQKPR